MLNPTVRDGARLRAFPHYVPPATAALATLEARCCRWPLGEVESDAFRFCGAPSGYRRYCPAHAAMAARGHR